MGDFNNFGTNTSGQSRISEEIRGKDRPFLSELVKAGGKKSREIVAALQTVNSHPLCGTSDGVTVIDGTNSSISKKDPTYVRSKADFLSQGIALVCLQYHTPITLVNSIRTWNSSGLLKMMHEKLIILNDPYPIEIAISREFGFKMLQPKDIPNAKMVKPNVLTIGAAFFYALQSVKSEYVLFLENDFKMDSVLTKDQIISQLIGASGMLNRGIEVIRLMAKKTQGCGTFKVCNHRDVRLTSEDPQKRLKNWYSFYCSNDKDKSSNYVSDCLYFDEQREDVAFKCFTSWDSNWSLNAAMVKKSTMLNKKYGTTVYKKALSIAEIGLRSFDRQDGFEANMIHGVKWMYWKVPICIAAQGLFIHEEIETAA
jgi:hypothetical protein